MGYVLAGFLLGVAWSWVVFPRLMANTCTHDWQAEGFADWRCSRCDRDR